VAHALSDEMKNHRLWMTLKVSCKYCNKNCIGCIASSLETARFSCYDAVTRSLYTQELNE